MRRMFWMGVGAVAGASGTVWLERKVRSRLEALQPDHLVVVAGRRARDVGRVVADAVVEGRDAMREREAELRDRRDGGPRHRPGVTRGGRHVARSAPSPRPARPGGSPHR